MTRPNRIAPAAPPREQVRSLRTQIVLALGAVLLLAAASLVLLTLLSSSKDQSHLVLLDVATDPVAADVAAALYGGDTRAALRVTAEAIAADPQLLRHGFALAYTVGRLSLDHYSDLTTAFQACDGVFLNGCYTGVLHQQVLRSGLPQANTIAELCVFKDGAAPDPSASVSCARGLGAALFAATNKALTPSLEMCDQLPAEQRLLCHNGVFGANTDLLVQHLTADDGVPPHTHDKGVPPGPLLRLEDPHYPCNQVAPRHQVPCYSMQPWSVLVLRDFELGPALSLCETAPLSSRPACFSGLGQNLAGPTRDTLGTLGGCSGVTSRYKEFCFGGALSALLGTDQLGAACPTVPEADKAACYVGLGTQISRMHPQTTARQAECAKVELAYRASCERGTQTLPPQN